MGILIYLGSGFKHFFSPIWGRWTHFDPYFSDGLTPPTRYCDISLAMKPDSMESGMGCFFFFNSGHLISGTKNTTPQPYYSHTTPIRITLELRLRMRLVVLGCHDFCGAHRWTSLLFHRCLGLKKKLGEKWQNGRWENGGKVKVRAFSEGVIGVVGAWCVSKNGEVLLKYMTDRQRKTHHQP